MKNILIAVGVLIVIVAVGIYFLMPNLFKPKTAANITSFEECTNAGFLVVDTKPRECHTKSGQTFVEEYNGVLLQNSIVVTDPEANTAISTPFKVEGKAIGNWYFNNQLKATLQDANGKIIATKQLNALSTTQTDDFVPFVAAIDFQVLDAGTPKGRLLIEKTNQSYNSGETGPLVIPVTFAK